MGSRGSWGKGREELCGEAVASVKYDLAAPLCLSRRSGVGWGEGSPSERERKRELGRVIPPACIHDSDIRYQHHLEIKDGRHAPRIYIQLNLIQEGN